MSRRVANVKETPPRGWRFEVGGKLIGPFPARVQLMGALRQHYEANATLPPPDLDTLVDEYICSKIDSSLCVDSETAGRFLRPPDPVKVANSPAQFNAVVQGTKILAEWFITGRLMGKRKLVSVAQANQRGAVCVSCPHNVPVGRCAPCVAGRLSKAVTAVVGNSGHTDMDGQLQACNLCGCALKAKVWMPLELLHKHMSPEHLKAFPNFCWLVTEQVDKPSGND